MCEGAYYSEKQCEAALARFVGAEPNCRRTSVSDFLFLLSGGYVVFIGIKTVAPFSVGLSYSFN